MVKASCDKLQQLDVDLYNNSHEVQSHGELLVICERLAGEDQLSDSLLACRQALKSKLAVVERAFRSGASSLYRQQALQTFSKEGSRVEHLDSLATWIYREAKRNSRSYPEPIITFVPVPVVKLSRWQAG